MHTLAQMRHGSTAKVRSLDGHPDLRLRLQEMGFTPGVEVRLVARAAFGGPIAFALRGTTVALRREDAHCIQL